MIIPALVTSVLLNGVVCADVLTFPPGFKFGAASSAFQVEGAWNVSDKSESIWDRYIRDNPDTTADGSNAQVAADSYHRWREDVQLAADLGLHYYRFSISWPRLLPTGFSNKISEDGRKYYNDLIDGLLENGVEPMVTLYHWDLPQRLQDLGGWTNPLISDWFAEYSRVVFSLYGDRVKTWITLNEPDAICDAAYNSGLIAPGIIDPDFANYICSKHVLIAHAKSWKIYDEEYRSTYGGRISITNELFWFEPHSEEDKELAEIANEYCTGRFSHPIFSKEGGWPPAIEKIVAENSKKEGYANSRLPEFTAEEIDLIRGSYDFYGANYYMTLTVRRADPGMDAETHALMGLVAAKELGITVDLSFASSGLFDEVGIYPEGLRRNLVWLKKKYGDIEVIITENGYGDSEYELTDDKRIQYIHDHLEQVLLAIKEDEVNVTAYTVWTLLDGFEWVSGYQMKMGLHEVNFTSAERTRTPRKSARYYAEVIKKHSLNVTVI